MLPGFRFLFAAILLCVSILIFGLGAAALLRAAHEEFASKPSWRGAPEASFAQHSAAPRPPVLALLKLEPKPEEQKEAGRPIATAPADAPAAAPAPTQGQPQGTTIAPPSAFEQALPQPAPIPLAARETPPTDVGKDASKTEAAETTEA